MPVFGRVVAAKLVRRFSLPTSLSDSTAVSGQPHQQVRAADGAESASNRHSDEPPQQRQPAVRRRHSIADVGELRRITETLRPPS